MSNAAIDQDRDLPSAPDVRPVPRISIQAFCDTPEFAALVETASDDRRMARAHVKIDMGSIEAAITHFQSTATPNLVIVETQLPPDQLQSALDRLSDVCDPGTRVVVVGHINDIGLYRSLIQRGVSEYLVMPIDLLTLIGTISSLFSDAASGPLGRSIAFIGAKGGVGSSMIAHNVAWAIATDLVSDVVVADLDLAFGTAGLDFNQDPAQGIAEAVNAPERLDDVLLDRLLARCSDHLSLLAAPATLDRTYDFGEGAFEPVIEVAQAGVPVLILDLPHVWTSWARQTLLAADEIVLTAEPDLANLRNAKNIIDLLKQGRRNDVPPRLVINKAGIAKRPEIKVSDFASALDIEPLVTIPFDAHLFGNAANNGQMIAETDVKNPVTDSFRQIAQAVTGRGEAKRAKRRMFGPLVDRLRRKSA